MLECMKIAERPQFDLTPDDLKHVKHVVFDDSCFDVTEGGVIFRDLKTDEPLEPGQIPPIVRTDPAIAEGLDFLSEAGQSGDLTVELLLGNHGGVEDHREIQEAYGHKLEIASAVALETGWKTQMRTHVPSFANIQPDTAHSGRGRREFQKAQLATLKSLGAIALPCDISDAPDYQSEVSEELKWLWSLRDVARKRLKDPAQIHAARTIAERMYQGVRPWAMIGYLGQWTMQLQAQKIIPDRLTVPFILGSGHRHDSDRLNDISVPTEVHEVNSTARRDSPQRRRHRHMLGQASYDHELDWEALQTVLPTK